MALEALQRVVQPLSRLGIFLMAATTLQISGALMIGAYCLIFFGLAIFGAHRYWLVHRYFRTGETSAPSPSLPDPAPEVLVQLPLYNERYVAQRLLEAMGRLDYPRDRLRIQVLDDSDDATTSIVEEAAEHLRREGWRVDHVRRPDRTGYKAGALAYGLDHADAELIAIFDADFVPAPDFLRRTVGHFADPAVGMVQTRWTHINPGYSLLTRIQAMMLNGHFVMEHGGRHRGGCFFNFNGTAGIWRREAIQSAGGWQGDTVTEDLDLSYRAQLAGWRFLYRPDVESPSELPVQMSAFKNQQQRWTRGASQTARKLIGRLWRAPIPLARKVEGTLHLFGNTPYVLMVLLAALLLPVYWLRDRWNLGWVIWVDLPMLVAGTFALASFYANAERELGASPWRALARLPVLMALGVGLSINNAWAALDGFRTPGGEFVRTPKYRIESEGDSWRTKAYLPRRQAWIPLLETAMLIYLTLTAAFVLGAGLWWALPYLLLFIAGYAWVVAQTLLASPWWTTLATLAGPRPRRAT